MPHLMVIPREIRDLMLELTVLASRPAPETLADIETQALEEQHQYVYYSTDCLDCNRFAAVPLLLVSRQIHRETKQLLNRIGNTHELDVRFVHEQYFVLTWTRLPLSVHNVDHVCVVFKSVGEYRDSVEVCGRPIPNLWRSSRGGRPAQFQLMFYDVLMSFLINGPYGWRASRSAKTEGFTIRTLEVDFVDPDDTSLLIPEPDDPKTPLHRQGGKGLRRPERLAKCLGQLLASLLTTTVHQYGKGIFDKVGRIIIKANGKMVVGIKVGQILADYDFSDSFVEVPKGERLDHWKAWKDHALLCREAKGLDVSDTRLDWKEKAVFGFARLQERYQRDKMEKISSASHAHDN
ncbi:hypothetical protein P171DRAFT_222973 [Karstenula rhodostoma CBS 690.94]|uniref:Uncharacterized protein n=1 Tax=Karstenula rhodostoma CBS 690.94 TaxID=1392251 RepID=A0A9P4PPQ5_9PLEO|nr:hypothetical protein P171DRAFT_222973 [Karstenula rhodostoma CBS 690.94]